MLNDELLIYLFEEKPHILAGPMNTWLASSRRFASFVSTFRDKIRKKLRVTKDQETLQNLRLELETAYLLLQERALRVVYEPEHSGPGRSPDFAVSFTTSLTFMVEVTRLRGVLTGTIPAEGERLADAICSKLGQFPPQRSNVLIVGTDDLYMTHNELQAVMLRLQQRAERSDSTFWQRYGFRDRAGFFQQYQRLSEVLVRGSQSQAGRSALAWTNPQARQPLPGKARTALYRSHALKV